MNYIGKIDVSALGRVGILGHTGLIGSAFASMAKDDNTLLIGRQKTSDRTLDLRSETVADFEKALKGVDTLVHAAGLRDEDIKDDTLSGVLRSISTLKFLLGAARNNDVKHIIYISTAHVYGPLEGTIDEQTMPRPSSVYATSHLLIENLLRQFSQENGIKLVICRPNAVFGFGFDSRRFGRWHLAPFAIVKDIVHSKSITLRAPGAVRNFVSAQHIAAVCLGSMNSLAQSNDVDIVLNPVGHFTLSMREFSEKVIAIFSKYGYDDARIILGGPDEKTEFVYSSRIKQNEPKEYLGDFIKAAIRYYKVGKNGT